MGAETIWGKSDSNGDFWLPLWVHLYDTYRCADIVWGNTPVAVKNIILDTNPGFSTSQEVYLLYSFLAASHDLGKATPDFSGREGVKWDTASLFNRMEMDGYTYLNNLGIALSKRTDNKAIRHEMASAWILEKEASRLTDDEAYAYPLTGSKDKRDLRKRVDTLSCVLAGHHGKPTNTTGNTDKAMDALSEEWSSSQKELLDFVASLTPGVDEVLSKVFSYGGLSVQSQVLLTGLVIEADWMASNGDIFPLFEYETLLDVGDISSHHFEGRWDNINDRLSIPGHNILHDFNEETPSSELELIFERRFDFHPNQLQKETIRLTSSSTQPDVYIIESEMGSGKTEAALFAAEILAQRHDKDGFIFALPTMATSDALFSRASKYLKKYTEQTGSEISLSLAHSKAFFSKSAKEAQKFNNPGWYSGRYKKYLNSHIVGTIDNILMAGLKVKYTYWRHLGLASKVIIVDEAHAADPFMRTYLLTAIKWLSFYDCPVIILSATLTEDIKNELIQAYREGQKWQR